MQKNGGYAMEHAYAKDPQAAKNFCLLASDLEAFLNTPIQVRLDTS